MTQQQQHGQQDLTADLDRAAHLLAGASRVLVVAGAGMSVGRNLSDGYGRSFFDPASFAYFYPGQEHLKNSWAASWAKDKPDGPRPTGWWPDHTHMMIGGAKPNESYAHLLNILKNKDYFVMTSNVDGLFSRAGFAHDRIYTMQGYFRVRQCRNACSNSATWLARTEVDRLLPYINSENFELDPAAAGLLRQWKSCKRCGSEAGPNLRGGSNFIHAPYQEQQDRLVAWLEDAMSDAATASAASDYSNRHNHHHHHNNNRTSSSSSSSTHHNLVVLEIGAGFNSPGVTRFPAESIAFEAGAPFIRLNMSDSGIPAELYATGGGAVALPLDATDALRHLRAALEVFAASKAATANDQSPQAETAAASSPPPSPSPSPLPLPLPPAGRGARTGLCGWRATMRSLQDPPRRDLGTPLPTWHDGGGSGGGRDKRRLTGLEISADRPRYQQGDGAGSAVAGAITAAAAC